jgi:hypothetical protein
MVPCFYELKGVGQNSKSPNPYVRYNKFLTSPFSQHPILIIIPYSLYLMPFIRITRVSIVTSI